MSDTESQYDSESESEIIERTKELLKLRKEKIEQIFCPQTERERKCLYSIAQEVDFIDIKPYSHNIIGLNLEILKDKEGYYDSKLKEVVKMFKLDKKGWGYLL